MWGWVPGSLADSGEVDSTEARPASADHNLPCRDTRSTNDCTSAESVAWVQKIAPRSRAHAAAFPCAETVASCVLSSCGG
eukprot:2176073-Rhodomonas_salina.2